MARAIGEWFRQTADLEHWAAFRASFDRLTALVEKVAAGGPASVNVLSGDVRHSDAARATLPSSPSAPVHQLTCSPVHNKIEFYVKPGFRFVWSRTLRDLTARWALRVGGPPMPLTWERTAGPLFGSTVATLDVDGRSAHVVFEQPRTAATPAERARMELT